MDHPGSKKARRPLVTILALVLAPPGCSTPTAMSATPPATEQLVAQAPAAEATAAATAAAPAPSRHDHDHFRTLPVDIARSFAAFTLSFYGKDGGQCLGVPEWVAYELRATPAGLGQAPIHKRAHLPVARSVTLPIVSL